MKESEMKAGSSEARKEKIRKRYKGIDPDELYVVPAVPVDNFFDSETEKRVAVYARVSTDDPNQTSSYELQKIHYLDMIARHPNWHLVGIYADEGISGTSLAHRVEFQRLIEDCEAGKIDMILTKSVSRFARNVLIGVGLVRRLKELNPPVGVYFETEGLYSLNSNSEMSLSFISTMAQEESHTKSDIQNSSVEWRFSHGIFLTPKLLGYDLDEDGNLIINESEANTVRLIFFMCLYGYSTQQIADEMTMLKRPTKKGNTKWSASTIRGVLQNERHCGDVKARKTYTPDYLTHKSKKNRQNRNQYIKYDHHEAIISREDFNKVQQLLANAKYGGTGGFLPELYVMRDGMLSGFVSINPRWAGFTVDDYFDACRSVQDDTEREKTISAQGGEFDLRGFQIARGQFFDTANKTLLTFSEKHITFSSECVRKFQSEYVELFVHPSFGLFAIRPAKKEDKNAIRWAKQKNGVLQPKQVGGAAFLPRIYEMFSWDIKNKYRLMGIRVNHEQESILLFNMNDTEIMIPASSLVEEESEENALDFSPDYKVQSTPASLIVYPKDWLSGFGCSFYDQASEQMLMEGRIGTSARTSFMGGDPENTTPRHELNIQISTLRKNMTQEVINE